MVIFNRAWSMPNKNTFDIPCINRLIHRYAKSPSVDPFANSNRICDITNDIDPKYGCDYSMDATDFLKQQPTNYFKFILYDPPYSSRQVSESYTKMGMTVNHETTQSSYWTKQKKQIARICDDNGIVISFGWNSNGIGKKLGFEIMEILLVAHGGAHNDTIVTVERKFQSRLF